MKPKIIQDQALIIFGASGDLTYRKLIPAIFDLHKQNSLPKNFAVLGVARSSFTDDSFREKMKDGIRQFATAKDIPDDELNTFCQKLHYLSINTDDNKEYSKLKERLELLDKEEGTSGNYIFYLSTPPSLYPLVPKYLAEQGLNEENGNFRRIIIEKPFGTDLKSAIELNKSLGQDYDEEQIYRIDHYLGKETVQNMLVTRFANGIYEPLWNRNYIHHVEITAAESIGVENRGGYYDHSGALRDMVQNHLLQLVALVAMEPPMSIDSVSIRNEKLKVFQALRPMSNDDLFKNVIRGQYTAANIKGKYAKGYREEKDVNPDSRTETYVAMKLFIDNWRWGDVPFYVRTGKRLPTRVSEVVIHFKPAPQRLFPEAVGLSNDDNQLVIRIQPDEGILLKTKMKVPGSGYQVKNVNMDFHYSELQNTYLPEAYERLLLDCMVGDSTLYIRGDALEATWKFVQPLLDFWDKNPDAPLNGYPAGSWGPANADDLIEEKNLTWRYPCKNLSDDGIYCEL
ncbi:glucose-6-phosphate dehydrogenase [Dysgonomonas sp. Marseille-P4677]|uniref:glucose-6-phosphate dehydrogenase n=1 Tax=Dysgonomonas sp. Marseille-P4677 TaxID=2364790 RepID=UPI001914D717|nr:glucose-6-phosphate dehydrogenase [Dysgonomonas sp. Marseille-P4677]MBK5719476.1 glucose-6-phosphate dehydrogenase [Dysgonomonas sp. Marseille-P4677]